MNRLAMIALLLVSAWLGAALIVATAVAPAAFRVLPTRTMAGAVVGQVLPVIFISGLLIAAAATLLAVRGPRSVGDWVGMAMLGTMMVACIVAQFIIGPRIEATRAAIGGPIDAVAVSDPRRVEFGRLHAFSVLWMGAAMVGAGGAIVQKLTQRT